MDHLISLESYDLGGGGEPSFVAGAIHLGSEIDGGLINAGDGNDPSDFVERLDINVTGGNFEGVLGEDGLVIAISADGDNIFYGGGMLAE